MPLMSSPIDGSPMREIERYGVHMDICPTSGGIWLDRGELEKIIMMIRQEALAEAGAAAHQPPPAPTQTRAQAQAYVYHAYQERRERPRKEKKRDSMFENIMDIFDL